jgi:hypothetical protein
MGQGVHLACRAQPTEHYALGVGALDLKDSGIVMAWLIPISLRRPRDDHGHGTHASDLRLTARGA